MTAPVMADRMTLDNAQHSVMYTLLVPCPADSSQPGVLAAVQDKVLCRFGGVTTLAPSRGLWIAPSGAVYADTVYPVQCVAPAADEAQRWFCQLAAEIAQQTGCLEVFLLVQPVVALPVTAMPHSSRPA